MTLGAPQKPSFCELKLGHIQMLEHSERDDKGTEKDRMKMECAQVEET